MLGHIIETIGVRVDPKKFNVIQNTPPPTNMAGLRSVLGIAGYYGRFIRSFADMSACLHKKMSLKVKIDCTAKMNVALESLEKALTSPPVLDFPDFKNPFLVDKDASAVA